jgi:hypothetical protein
MSMIFATLIRVVTYAEVHLPVGTLATGSPRFTARKSEPTNAIRSSENPPIKTDRHCRAKNAFKPFSLSVSVRGM